MGKVYIVTEGCYSDYQIIAAFSDKDKADRYAGIHDDAEVEEWALDEPESEWPVVKVMMRENGNVHEHYAYSGDCTGFEKFLKWTIPPVYNKTEFILSWVVRTHDPQHAYKVVAEKHAEIIAADAWGDDAKVRQLFQ